MNSASERDKMAVLVNKNPYLLFMLEHFGISLGFKDKDIKEICAENGIDIYLFILIINIFNGIKIDNRIDYLKVDVMGIIEYLKNSHKYYIEDRYPEIKICIEKICKKNSKAVVLINFFDNYFDEVVEHMNYENEIVFPYVINLRDILFNGINIRNKTYSVNNYREHHNDISEKLSDLKNLLIKYLPIEDDVRERRNLLMNLFELEYNLNIHSRIEEELLIPIIEKMENNI